jgi:hypothetical protein
MLDTTIHLALTDDWELRGDGSGDISRIQFYPMTELLRIYGKYGVKGTFNVEVMQQLTFRKLQDKFRELRPLADAWDEHVRGAFEHGQDIQLHIHPQWSKARYEGGRWLLSGDWSLLRYDPDAAHSMLAAGKRYLEDLLRPLDPAYKCLSFRSGSSCIAPSPFALGLLARLGIVFDMSIVGGLRVKTRNLDMDYTNCEESFLPFYPRLEDARKVSDKPEPIICVPIFHFYLSRRRAFTQVLSKGWQKARQKIPPGAKLSAGDHAYSSREWQEVGRSSKWARVYDKAVKPCLRGKYMVADIGQLDYKSLREMLAAIRRAARSSGLREVPVILTNHSKYVRDFSHIERFIRDAAEAEDIKFATLTRLAEKLQAGEFPVKVAGGNSCARRPG